MSLPLLAVFLSFAWINPAMREHEDEFRQAWVQRYGTAGLAPGGGVPKATYKAWYKQFKQTGIRPAEWLTALSQGPPGSSQV